MADEPLISIDQLLARPGFADVDPGQAQALIDDASALVRDIAAPVVLDPAALPASLVPVIVGMVRRGFANPLGRTGESIGDYSWQAAGNAMSGIYATRKEKIVIRRAVGKLGVGTAQLEGDLPLREVAFGFENELLGSL